MSPRRLILGAQLRYTRARRELDALHAALGGVCGAVAGLALALIVVRPLLSLLPGWAGVWR